MEETFNTKLNQSTLQSLEESEEEIIQNRKLLLEAVDMSKVDLDIKDNEVDILMRDNEHLADKIENLNHSIPKEIIEESINNKI